MTDQERKTMLILADTIKGEINRMCVAKELSEVDTMALHARKNIEKLQAMRYTDFKTECEEVAEKKEGYGMNKKIKIEDLAIGDDITVEGKIIQGGRDRVVIETEIGKAILVIPLVDIKDIKTHRPNGEK